MHAHAIVVHEGIHQLALWRLRDVHLALDATLTSRKRVKDTERTVNSPPSAMNIHRTSYDVMKVTSPRGLRPAAYKP